MVNVVGDSSPFIRKKHSLPRSLPQKRDVCLYLHVRASSHGHHSLKDACRYSSLLEHIGTQNYINLLLLKKSMM